MFYRAILKNAWRILWRAKYLWFFGLFAVLVTNSGEMNLVIDNVSRVNERANFLQELKLLYQQGGFENVWQNLVQIGDKLGWLSVLVVFLFVVGFILLVWLTVISQGALISGAYKNYCKQVSGFKNAFKVGLQNFWKLLGVNVLGKLIVFLLSFLISLPLVVFYFNSATDTLKSIFVWLSFIILIPLAVVISFLMRYASMYVVLKKEKIKGAIKKAWQLFIKNWVVSIEMAIIMFLVTLCAGLIMIIASIVLAIPLSFLIYLFFALKVGGALWVSIVISLILFIALLFWLGALLSTYQAAVWVILFDKIEANQVFSKLARIVGSLGKKEKVNNNDLFLEE